MGDLLPIWISLSIFMSSIKGAGPHSNRTWRDQRYAELYFKLPWGWTLKLRTFFQTSNSLDIFIFPAYGLSPWLAPLLPGSIFFRIFWIGLGYSHGLVVNLAMLFDLGCFHFLRPFPGEVCSYHSHIKIILICLA
jgi:hypothetical protein